MIKIHKTIMSFAHPSVAVLFGGGIVLPSSCSATSRWTRGIRGGVSVPLFVMLSALLGCLGDSASAPALHPAASTLGAASASPLNAIMAVDETLHVALDVKTLTGTPVTDFDSVQYILERSVDTQYVQVLPAGAIVGRRPTIPQDPVHLWMVAFKGGALVADLTIIQITQTVLPRAVLSIQPVSPDSARWPILQTKALNPIVRDPVTDSTILGVTLRLEYGAHDSTYAGCYQPKFNGNYANPLISVLVLMRNNCGDGRALQYIGENSIASFRPDTIWVHANVLAYGTMLRDSVRFIFTNAPENYVTLYPDGSSQGVSTIDVTIASGGHVGFYNGYDPSYGTSVDFIFDDSAAAGPDSPGADSGNVTGIASGQFTWRRFLAPGQYGYTYTFTAGMAPLKGMSGRGTITVQ